MTPLGFTPPLPASFPKCYKAVTFPCPRVVTFPGMTNSIKAEPITIGLRRDPPHLFKLGDWINAASVDELRSHIRGITIAPRRLNLACGTVQGIDPVGAALLWLLCKELERSVGTHVRLVHLALPVAQKLRGHPLSLYVVYGDEMFQDSFPSPTPSNR